MEFRIVGVNEIRTKLLTITNNNPIDIEVTINLEPIHNVNSVNLFRITFDELFSPRGSLERNRSLREPHSNKKRQVFRLEHKQSAVLGFRFEARQIESGS
jgi:hypothetical protein